MKPLIYFLITLFHVSGHAQEIHLVKTQDLDFGKFYLMGSGGGRITVHEDGTWIDEGHLRHLEVPPKPAIFTIWTESPEPIKIRVEVVYSKLSNSDEPMDLSVIGENNLDYHVLSQRAPLQVKIGGVLDVEPRGSGFGTFQGQVMIRTTKVPF